MKKNKEIKNCTVGKVDIAKTKCKFEEQQLNKLLGLRPSATDNKSF